MPTTYAGMNYILLLDSSFNIFALGAVLKYVSCKLSNHVSTSHKIYYQHDAAINATYIRAVKIVCSYA